MSPRMTRLVRMLTDTRTYARDAMASGGLTCFERQAMHATVKVLCAVISLIDEETSRREQR